MGQEHAPVVPRGVSIAGVRDTLPAALGEPLPSLMFCGTLRDAAMEDAVDVRSPVVSRDNRRMNRKAG